jgi:glycosyltransferase involved in cell wall biosynthesis
VGFVEDVEPCFAASRIFVSPLRYGAGMKGKVGQSMAHGLPVVTTSIGAEGMQLIDGDTALIADAPGDFARAVVRAYQDEALWTRLSTRGRDHIERHFSRTASRARLQHLLALDAEVAG